MRRFSGAIAEFRKAVRKVFRKKQLATFAAHNKNAWPIPRETLQEAQLDLELDPRCPGNGLGQTNCASHQSHFSVFVTFQISVGTPSIVSIFRLISTRPFIIRTAVAGNAKKALRNKSDALSSNGLNVLSLI